MRYDDKHKRDCVQNNTGIKSNIWSISSSSTLVKLVKLAIMANYDFFAMGLQLFSVFPMNLDSSKRASHRKKN